LEGVNAKISVTQKMLDGVNSNLKNSLDALHKEMKKKGLKDELQIKSEKLLNSLDSSTKELKEKIDSLQKKVKETRSLADISKCNSANLLKSISQESIFR